MQMSKIKRMPVWRINEWLSAIGKLLKHYEGRVTIDYCPLCIVFSCGGCLWRIIEGKSCENFARELYGDDADASDCRNNLRLKRWKIARLGQLRNWKKILKIELARREL